MRRCTGFPRNFTSPWLEIASVVGLGLVLILRLQFFAVQPWDSDERQHLHVVWGWTHGLLGYRDFFDNHCPLFHLLAAPLFLSLGERANIVELMRWINLPLFAAVLWCVFQLGQKLFSVRVGIAAALLVGLFPPFFLKAGEFRPDNLWTVEWLSALVVLLGAKATTTRYFIGGTLLGAALVTSMKTVLLLLTLGLAVFFLIALKLSFIRSPVRQSSPKNHVFILGSAFLVGFCLFPILLLVFFGATGNLTSAYNCILKYNLLPDQPFLQMLRLRIADLRFWLLLPCAWLARKALLQNSDQAGRQALLFLVVGSFCTILLGLWPVITRQDYLPFIPIAGIVVVYLLDRIAALVCHEQALGASSSPAKLGLFALALMVACLGQLFWLAKISGRHHRPNTEKIAQLAEILRLTRPGEKVFDAKGEAIFRARPTYLVYETLTRRRIALGQLKDDLPERLIATQTPVGIPFDFATERTRQFVERNYFLLRSVFVLGQHLPADGNQAVSFNIEIPGTYTFMSEKGLVPGALDGQPAKLENDLTAGLHRFKPEQVVQSLDVLWSRALAVRPAPL